VLHHSCPFAYRHCPSLTHTHTHTQSHPMDKTLQASLAHPLNLPPPDSAGTRLCYEGLQRGRSLCDETGCGLISTRVVCDGGQRAVGGALWLGVLRPLRPRGCHSVRRLSIRSA
jgi:hypothetical protein